MICQTATLHRQPHIYSTTRSYRCFTTLISPCPPRSTNGQSPFPHLHTMKAFETPWRLCPPQASSGKRPPGPSRRGCPLLGEHRQPSSLHTNRAAGSHTPFPSRTYACSSGGSTALRSRAGPPIGSLGTRDQCRWPHSALCRSLLGSTADLIESDINRQLYAPFYWLTAALF